MVWPYLSFGEGITCDADICKQASQESLDTSFITDVKMHSCHHDNRAAPRDNRENNTVQALAKDETGPSGGPPEKWENAWILIKQLHFFRF